MEEYDFVSVKDMQDSTGRSSILMLSTFRCKEKKADHSAFFLICIVCGEPKI